MKKKNIPILLFLIVLVNVSYSQSELSKDEVHLKLIEFSDQYKQLVNFSSSDSKMRNDFVINFLKLTGSMDKAILVNDLPIPNKQSGKISITQYADLLFSTFKDGLRVTIEVQDISQKQLFDGIDRWHGEILFNKTLSGTIDGGLQQLNLKLRVRVALFKDEFKILSMDSPYDLDADGVSDENDLCMLQPGLISNSGCPDTDGDGIVDYIDKEPNSQPDVKVNKHGMAKGRFWRNATYSLDLTLANYNFIIPEELSTPDYNFKSLWKSDFLSSALVVINNPMIYFSDYTIDLNTGIGFTKFTYYFKAREIIDGTSTTVIKYNGFDIPREDGSLNYLTIPLGLKLKNDLYYISVGTILLIKNSSSYRKGWVYDLPDSQANPQKLDGDGDLTESMKNMPVSPYVEFGIHMKIFNRFHFKTGINYTYLKSFNKKSNAKAGTAPHFIGLPNSGDLNIHSLNLKVGFIYGIN